MVARPRKDLITSNGGTARRGRGGGTVAKGASVIENSLLEVPAYRHAFQRVWERHRLHDCVHLPLRHDYREERPILWLGASAAGPFSKDVKVIERLAAKTACFLHGDPLETYRRSPFWNILRQILDDLDREFIWSNVFKGGHRAHSSLPMSIRNTQAADSAELLAIEIQEWDPEIVVINTGCLAHTSRTILDPVGAAFEKVEGFELKLIDVLDHEGVASVASTASRKYVWLTRSRRVRNVVKIEAFNKAIVL